MAIFLRQPHLVKPTQWGSDADISMAVRKNCEKIYGINSDFISAVYMFLDSAGLKVKDYGGHGKHTDIVSGSPYWKKNSLVIENSAYLSHTGQIIHSIPFSVVTILAQKLISGVSSQGLIAQADSSDSSDYIQLYISSGSGASYIVRNGTTVVNGPDYAVVQEGSFSQIKSIAGVSYASNNHVVFNDGIRVGSENTIISAIPTADRFSFGSCLDSSPSYTDGYFGAHYVFSAGLSQDQVMLLNDLPYGLFQKLPKPVYFLLPSLPGLDAANIESSSQITIPSFTVKRQIAIPNIGSSSQVTAPTVEKGWLYSQDIPCNTQITVPSFTVKRQIAIPNIGSSSQVTAPTIFAGGLDANDIPCNTEITVPSFSAKRPLSIPNIESSSEVTIPSLERLRPLNAPDISSNTQITAASIYKELLPSNIESSSEVEAGGLEWVKVLKLNATIPMMTAEMSGGHGGFLNVALPMITAEMRGGAQLNVTLPMITAELEGKVGIKADLNVTLPMITVAITGTTEVLAQLNATIPMIQARLTGTAGQVGQINAALPMITASLTGYPEVTGQLNATLPMIEAYLTGAVDRFTECEALRYAEPELE